LVCFFAIILFPAVLMLPNSGHLHKAVDMRVRIADDTGAQGTAGDRPGNQSRGQGHGFAHDKCLACALIGSAAKQLKQFCSVASGASTGSVCPCAQAVAAPLSAQLEYDTPLALKTKLNN